MTDHSELKRLAERVIAIEATQDELIQLAWDEFEAAANPAAVLALIAENERLQKFEAAYTEWSAKTDWVQETIQGYELGMHRADVLHKRCRDGAFHQQAQADRIKELMAEAEVLSKDAQRYRWLRSRESSDDPEISVTRWAQLSPDRATGEAPRLEALDAAIDAAMSKEPSN